MLGETQRDTDFDFADCSGGSISLLLSSSTTESGVGLKIADASFFAEEKSKLPTSCLILLLSNFCCGASDSIIWVVVSPLSCFTLFDSFSMLASAIFVSAAL
ncbi:hypothetical protein AQUCO_00100605v1 [Aquilegia coerulea]|uniref:Uncharacterized protein n=1 Tax=Aquilegia coerulea TaxID=218851 RepID=A0A2G5FB37_AQUCA|nr:hypothetical protein AQUCO_00100605v1 [Aquilegia coerulea]